MLMPVLLHVFQTSFACFNFVQPLQRPQPSVLQSVAIWKKVDGPLNYCFGIILNIKYTATQVIFKIHCKF